jgi:hypothetical protein
MPESEPESIYMELGPESSTIDMPDMPEPESVDMELEPSPIDMPEQERESIDMEPEPEQESSSIDVPKPESIDDLTSARITSSSRNVNAAMLRCNLRKRKLRKMRNGQHKHCNN